MTSLPATLSAVELWSGVARLIDRAASLDDLRAHRLHLLAARRWRAQGWAIPDGLHHEERRAAAYCITAPLVLERLREASDSPVVLLKGLELGAHYPDAALRPSADIDVLVAEPDEVQRRLIRLGFVPIGEPEEYYAAAHHLRPLLDPLYGLKVEVHRRPEWVTWATAPAPEELLAAAVPSTTGLNGIYALPPHLHVLAVAAHAWSSSPLGVALDVVDLAAVLLVADRTECRSEAQRLGLTGVLETTAAAAASLMLDVAPTWALRTWARDLYHVREPTVFDTHMHRLTGPIWALPLRRTGPVMMATLKREVTPGVGESWHAKLARIRLALRHAFRRRSEHDRDLGG